MSIRTIARDLYRFKKEVERLEQELKETPYENRADIEDRLRKAKAERNRIQGMLDGSKEPPPHRKPL